MTDPAEVLRIWQPVIDLAREFAHAEDDPEEYEVDIAEAVYKAEAAMEEAKRRADG